MAADTYHMFKPNMNFHRGFHLFQWIRGQEYDGYRAAMPVNRRLEDHVNENYDAVWRGRVLQFLKNMDDCKEPEDYPCCRTFDTGIEYLRATRSDPRPKFLWIDTFQNHEPWMPPERFDRYLPEGYSGPNIILPMGGDYTKWGDEDIAACVRGHYAGDAAYVDWCVGRLLDALDDMGYLDDTLICVLSDHGHPLGDHGKFLKGGDRMYSELLKVPFILRFPGGEGGGQAAGRAGAVPGRDADAAGRPGPAGGLPRPGRPEHDARHPRRGGRAARGHDQRILPRGRPRPAQQALQLRRARRQRARRTLRPDRRPPRARRTSSAKSPR